MLNRLPMFFTSVAIGITLAGAALVLIGSEAKAKPMALYTPGMATSQPGARPEVTLVADQFAQESNKDSKTVMTYIEKIRALHRENKLAVGSEFLIGAAIVQQGTSFEDAIFAHELALAALANGELRAKPLVAATLDQIMVRLGQKQRFGTQMKGGGLAPVAEATTDHMRLVFGVPSLLVSKKLIKNGKPFQPPTDSVLTGTLSLTPTAVAVAVAE